MIEWHLRMVDSIWFGLVDWWHDSGNYLTWENGCIRMMKLPWRMMDSIWFDDASIN